MKKKKINAIQFKNKKTGEIMFNITYDELENSFDLA
jgi:hypothetical protein